MSNALAIATVTRALGRVVEDAAASVVPGAQVLTSRPEANGGTAARIHLFLYQVAPDAAQRNNDLPTRSSDGTLRQRPTVALDLYYLLTFNGQDTSLDTHRMLGAVARDLHARPVLPRSLIQSVSSGDLAGSDLADSFDVVRVSPLSLTVDDLSKLWLMFSQTPYSLSVAYQARVVLIESVENAGPVLPVLYRGKDDTGVDVQAGTLPVLDDYEITAADAPLTGPRLPSWPAAQLGLRVFFTGRNLGGDTVALRFRHPRLASVDIPIASADRTAESIRFVVPNDAAAETAWAAGIYLVSVRVTTGSFTRSSPEVPLPFAPAYTAIAPPSPVTGAGTDLTLTLTCRPQIAPGQRAEITAGSGYAVTANPTVQTASLAFTIRNAPAVADDFLRLRVDGVDSFVFTQQGTPPKFVLDGTKRITIT